jgi:hypothetical protein
MRGAAAAASWGLVDALSITLLVVVKLSSEPCCKVGTSIENEPANLQEPRAPSLVAPTGQRRRADVKQLCGNDCRDQFLRVDTGDRGRSSGATWDLGTHSFHDPRLGGMIPTRQDWRGSGKIQLW